MCLGTLPPPRWKTAGLPVAFRDATAEDEALVFNAWLMGHRQNGDWPKRVSSRRYFDEHKVTITKLLARSRTIVACNAEKPAQAFGFVVFEPRPLVLHWLFTKQPFRHMDIGRGLAVKLPDSEQAIQCSHWTVASEGLRANGWGLRYDPFFLENLP